MILMIALCAGGCDNNWDFGSTRIKLGDGKLRKRGSIKNFNRSYCGISWRVDIINDKNGESLKLICDYKKKCSKTFREQAKAHRRILEEVFTVWDKADVSNISLPPLRKLQPDLSWSLDIAKRSSSNKNQNFTKLFKNSSMDKKVRAIFTGFGLNVELSHHGADQKKPPGTFFSTEQLTASGLNPDIPVTVDGLGLWYIAKPSK